MKKTAYILFLLLIPLLVPAQQVVAAESDVYIHNDVNSSTSQSSSSNCQTNIHTDTNGNVKDYVSSDCNNGDVHIQNGSTSVDVNNNTGNNDITPPDEPTISITPPTLPTINLTPIDISPTIAAERKKLLDTVAQEKARIEEEEKQNSNLLQQLKNFFKHLLSFFK